MARTIWKFQLEITPQQTLHLPRVRELLTVQLQYGSPCLWAVVAPETALESLHIVMHGTGHAAPDPDDGYRYIGTVQMEGFVWHYFAK